MNTVSSLLKRIHHFAGYVQVQKFSEIASKPLNSWDLMSAVCLERYPVISKQYTEFESKFSRFLEHVDLEQSLKSDHELRLEEDYLRSDQFKRGKLEDSELEHVTSIQTAQDFEDASNNELQQFTFGQRETDEEIHNVKNSVRRALDSYLILLVKQLLGKRESWILPQGQRLPEESMRQAAERILKTLCGDQLKVKYLGNAPIAFYKYKYPPLVQKERDSLGAKVFFFRAQYLDGDVLPGKDVSNYLWLTSDELKTVLTSNYYKTIKNVLIENTDMVF